MSVTKHTPGPWEPLTFSNHELQTDFAMVKLGSRVHMVGYSDEDKANARLIAAAPELLEALKPFAVYGRPGSRDVEVGAAITAIAKATGGAARALEGESIPWKLRKAAAELRQLHDQKIELLRARQVLGLECVKLQAQRDELLAALHHIEAIGMTKEDRVALREILQAARAAIAKATGGAPCL